MQRQKAIQLEVYDGSQTRQSPVWTKNVQGKKRKMNEEPEAGSSLNTLVQDIQKRPKKSGVSQEVMLNSFNESMKEYIKKQIAPSINKPGKLLALKAVFINKKRLPPGIFPRADEIAGCAQGEISTFFDSPEGPAVRNVEKWKHYATEHFDSIKDELISPSNPPLFQQPSSSRSALESDVEDINTTSQMLSLSSQASDADMLSQRSNVEIPLEIEDIETFSQSSQSTQTQQESLFNREYRAVPAYFSSIFHKDLDADMKKEVYKKLNDALYKVSDFTNIYGTLIYSLMISMKNLEFTKDGSDNISIKQCPGFEISKVFPLNFKSRSKARFTATPLTEEILASKKFRTDYATLFQNQHLKFINTEFFGSRGFRQDTVDSHPVQHQLNSTVKPYISEIVKKEGSFPSYITSLALDQYNTNLTNMWSGNKQINKILNRVLEVLLKIHLAPKREEAFMKHIHKNKTEQSRKKDATKSTSFKQLTRNQKRNLIRNENYKLKKIKEKIEKKSTNTNIEKWKKKRDDYENSIKVMKQTRDEVAKINILKEKEKKKTVNKESPENVDTVDVTADVEDIPYTDQLDQEDKTLEENGDLSRRRLTELKAIIKDALFKFQGQELSEQHLLKTTEAISSQEMEVCLLVANTIMPYLPSKENRFLIAYQLPLVLFGNDILCYAGYSKFCQNICPLSSPSKLHALKIDSTSIYTIMTQTQDNSITMRDFQEYTINSQQQARTLKDAVFYSFFDLPKLRSICQSRKLVFAHHLVVLPGLKIVQITGEKVSSNQSKTNKESKHTKPTADLPLDDIIQLQLKTDAELNEDILQITNNVTGLLKDLKTCHSTVQKEDFAKQIITLKSRWISKKKESEEGSIGDTEHNNAIYFEIEDVKNKRKKLESRILSLQSKISHQRHRKYICIKAKSLRGSRMTHTESKSNRHKIERSPGSRVLKKAKDMELPKNNEVLNNFTFSGTDNGIVTMTETLAFSYARFQYHLDLHNRYAPLLNDSNEHDEDSESGTSERKDESAPVVRPHFIPLGKSFKIKSDDIDYHSGHLRERKKLERQKKQTPKGKAVCKIEEKMTKLSVKSATSVADAVKIFTDNAENKRALREFYYSNNRALVKKRLMLLHNRCKDRVCSDERKKARVDGKHLVMLVGDRGFGYGSRIKGYRRYGGKWKQKLHSRYTTVAITNENKTSQTCVYCFSKIIHPKQRITKRNKTILKECNGAMRCINPECVSVTNGKSIQSRDKVSSMAIGISGLSMLLFQDTLPVFSTSNISQYKTDSQNKFSTHAFSKGSECRADSKTI